jgi:hypothetical protein
MMGMVADDESSRGDGVTRDGVTRDGVIVLNDECS